MIRIIAALIAGLTFVATGASLAAADFVPAGFDFQVNSTTSGEQVTNGASVARDADGNFVVVWTSADGDGTGVFGQRFDASGGRLGTEFQANSYTTAGQGAGHVSASASGQFAVVWTSFGQDGSYHGVFARSFGADGLPAGGEIQVNSATLNVQGTPRIAHDGAGNFVVVWTSNAEDQYRFDVMGRLFNASGNALGTEFQVNADTVDSESYPEVARNSAGNFVVGWRSIYGYPFNQGKVRVRRFDATGTPAGTEFVASADTALDPRIGSVGIDDAGNFLVAWSQRGSEPFVGFPYARKYDATGAPSGTEFPFDGAPHFSMAPDGTFVSVWTKAAVTRTWIVARKFDAAAAPLGSEFAVSDYLGGFDESPSVAVDPQGSFVVAWTSNQGYFFSEPVDTSYTRDGSGSGVFARRFCNTADASCDVCPGFDDSIDDDGDGIPNGCDPCTAVFAGQQMHDTTLDLRFAVYYRRINRNFTAGTLAPEPSALLASGTPLRSNRLRLTGELDLASAGLTFSSLHPDLDGARVRIESADGRSVVDQRIAGGTYGGHGTRGWHLDRIRNVWRFRDRTGNPANGFRTLVLEDGRARAPGTLRCTVKGSGGMYAALLEDDLPLKGIVVLGGQAAGDAGACGEASFAPGACNATPSPYAGASTSCSQ